MVCLKDCLPAEFVSAWKDVQRSTEQDLVDQGKASTIQSH